MNRLLIAALALALLPLAGTSDAQSIRRLSLDGVTGLHNTDTVYSDYPIVFHIRLTSASQTESPAIVLSNGFRIYSPTGAEWLTSAGTFTDVITNQMFGSVHVSPYSVTGSGGDSIVFNALGGFVGCGLPEPFDEVTMEIAIGPIDTAWAGHTVCLDSVSASWSWQLGQCDVWYGAVVPEWDGPHCFTVTRRPCSVIITGDANRDGSITTADILTIVNWIFKGGEPVGCMADADATCSGAVTAADVIYLVNYIFKGGPDPCNVCDLIWDGVWTCVAGQDPGEDSIRYFPEGVGDSWTFLLQDTGRAWRTVQDSAGNYWDSVYWTSPSVDTVMLSVVGDTMTGGGLPARQWEFAYDFSGPWYPDWHIGLDHAFITVHSPGMAGSDTLVTYRFPSSTYSYARFPVPFSIGQHWCLNSCLDSSYVRALDSVFVGSELVGEAFVIDRKMNHIEGWRRVTYKFVPYVGIVGVSFDAAGHDGGGSNWYGRRGTLTLLQYDVSK